jgi:hypothetical protein
MLPRLRLDESQITRIGMIAAKVAERLAVHDTLSSLANIIVVYLRNITINCDDSGLATLLACQDLVIVAFFTLHFHATSPIEESFICLSNKTTMSVYARRASSAPPAFSIC